MKELETVGEPFVPDLTSQAEGIESILHILDGDEEPDDSI